MPPYEPTLARIHDEAFTHHARAAADILAATLNAASISTGLIVDLGAGSGTLARLFTDRSFEVLGVDISPDMIDLAAHNAPDASFQCASFIDVDIPPCVAITALGEVFNYAFDDRAGLDAMRHLFDRAHTALQPGGIFMFDIATPGRGAPEPQQRYWMADDWIMLSRTQEVDQTLRREIITLVQNGDLYRRNDELHILHLYDSDAVCSLLDECGFVVDVVDRYGDRVFPVGYAGFIARRI